MKKTREQKGITLVALIITIVVLLELATVAISSIQNDGIISKAQDVANKFNQAQSNEQGILDEYLSYLEGDSGVPEELEKYILGPNKTGRLVTEVLDESTGMPKDEASTIPNASTAITIMNMSTNADSTKGLLNMVYKDKMYEVVADLSTYYTESIKYVRDIDPGLIFLGQVVLTMGQSPELPFTTDISLTRKYEIEVIVNGEKVTTYGEATEYAGTAVITANVKNEAVLFLVGNVVVMIATAEDYELTLTTIYDIGTSSTFAEENGFAAVKTDDGGWMLCGTPEEEYIVPENVKGNVINKVNIEELKGIPTFTRPVVIYNPADNAIKRPTAMKVTTTDLSFVFEMPGKDTWFNLEYMDFSECGDDIEFPEEFLSSGQYRWEDEYADGCAVVYVSSAVKAKYADYDFIQVKPTE